MAAVFERIRGAEVGLAREELCGGEELGAGARIVVEEAEHGGFLVEVAVAATEAVAGEEAAP